SGAPRNGDGRPRAQAPGLATSGAVSNQCPDYPRTSRHQDAGSQHPGEPAQVLATDALAVVQRHAPGNEQHTSDTEGADHPGHVTHDGDDALGPGGLGPRSRVYNVEEDDLGDEMDWRCHRYSFVDSMVRRGDG